MCRVRKLGVPTPVPYHVDSQHGLVYCSKVDATPLAQKLDAAQELDAGEECVGAPIGVLSCEVSKSWGWEVGARHVLTYLALGRVRSRELQQAYRKCCIWVCMWQLVGCCKVDVTALNE
jgi:hypothetical protein